MKKLNLVFDIGTNVGNTVEIFSKVSEKVIGFEPNPDLHDYLNNRFSSSNVIIDGRGISDTIGLKIFSVSNANTISTFSKDWIENSRFTGSYDWGRKIEVQTTTLNSIIDEFGQPDYIKIDVEGHEYEVLKCFNKLLDSTIISFEWAEEQKEKISLILTHLQKIGYNNFSYTDGDNVLFDNEITWSNFENFDLLSKIDEKRKEKWGMIYVKK